MRTFRPQSDRSLRPQLAGRDSADFAYQVATVAAALLLLLGFAI